MNRLFDGEVALVTGASSGIGRATSLAFAAEGAQVVVASRRSKESAETVNQITRAGGEAIFVKTDVNKPLEIESLIEQVIERYGQLNFAFNNAGIEGDPFVRLADYSGQTWDQVIATNLTGVFLSMKYELPHIIATKGTIVNMASVAGLSGGLVGAAYYASKHGVVGLTKAAALEYATTGVRINAVAPAAIKTPMTDRAFFHDADITAGVISRHPVGRVGNPEEVANAVVWLCSDRASFTTGHILPVDGGFLVP